MSYEWPEDFWPIQQRACQGVVDAIAEGHKRIVLTAPTGCGKSRAMCALIEWASSNWQQSALYTHRRMLLTQTAGVLTKHGIEHGLRAAGHEPALLRPVQVCMTQTEYPAVFTRKRRSLHPADLVLTDELHAQGGEMIQTIHKTHTEMGGVVVGVTATPIDLEGEWDKLVVAGNVSDGRACGALVPAITYCPDEPDMKHIKKYRVGEDLTDAQNKQVMMRPGVFGRVYKHYERLNPQHRPTILFAPDVAGSLYFAQEFQSKGIRAAHIDAKQIWYDGQFHDSDDENREVLLNLFRNGDLQVLTNRFVLREGIDLPMVAHAIFACVVGSLKSWLQMAGRAIRHHPDTPTVCIAKGTPILTDRGVVRIEDITKQHRVWDGVEFVAHDGLAINGITGTILWDGLRATPEHKVLTKHGWTTLAVAKARAWRLTRAAMGWRHLRVPDDSDPHNQGSWSNPGGGGGLQPVRKPDVRALSPDHSQDSQGVSQLHPALRATLSGVDIPPRAAPVAPVQRPEEQHVPPVWRQGHCIPVPVHLGCNALDCGCARSASATQIADTRPHRQQRALRARQPAMGQSVTTNEEPPQDRAPQQPPAPVRPGVPGCEILHQLSEPTVLSRPDSPADSTAMETEVYDIINAGPRHRYTAAGVIVGNCIQDHGANLRRHGSVNSNIDWQLGMSGYKITGMRQEMMRERPELEPIICPKCGAGRLSGPTCLRCGFTCHKRSRMVVQVNGDLRLADGPAYKPHRTKLEPDTAQKWKSMFHRACSKKFDGTFNQAMALFFREQGYYPPKDLPFMPTEPADFFEKCSSVPKERLL